MTARHLLVIIVILIWAVLSLLAERIIVVALYKQYMAESLSERTFNAALRTYVVREHRVNYDVVRLEDKE